MSHSTIADHSHQMSPAIADEIAAGFDRRAFPVKLCYLDVGADIHSEYAASQGYEQATGDGRAIAGFLSSIAGSEGWQSYGLVELGPGDGRLTAAILRGLRTRPDFYFCAEYSDRLREMVAQRVAAADIGIPDIRTVFGDIEAETGFDALPAPPQGIRPLGLFLGSTIGNVQDPQATLKNIFRGCPRVADWVVTCSVRDPSLSADELTRPYRTDVFAQGVVQPLRSAGVPSSVYSVDISFDGEQSAILAHAVFKETVVVPFGGREWVFDAGDRIRCFISRRFRPDEFETICVAAGAVPLRSEISEDGGVLRVHMCTHNSLQGEQA